MITLAFRTFAGDATVSARGAYFRIREATLRGPDDAMVALYVDNHWTIGARKFRGFECNAPIILRITTSAGERERLGPYEFLRISEGSVFTRESCLGTHARTWTAGTPDTHWREIVLLTADSADAPNERPPRPVREREEA